jgi:hypothetical protein
MPVALDQSFGTRLPAFFARGSMELAWIISERIKMNTYRKIAIIVGVLFIIGTVAGVLSGVITGPVLNDPEYLRKFSTSENQISLGALSVLIMGLALAMVPVVLFPIFKKVNESLALGYVVFRDALETVTYFPWVLSWLLLVTLSREYVKAGAPGASYFPSLGTLLLKAGDWNGQISYIVFSLGALMFYYLLYQSKLIPRWLSIWGLMGAILFLVEPLLALFGTKLEILFAPIFAQEMILAVWLIVKGFNPSALAALKVGPGGEN